MKGQEQWKEFVDKMSGERMFYVSEGKGGLGKVRRDVLKCEEGVGVGWRVHVRGGGVGGGGGEYLRVVLIPLDSAAENR